VIIYQEKFLIESENLLNREKGKKQQQQQEGKKKVLSRDKQ